MSIGDAANIRPHTTAAGTNHLGITNLAAGTSPPEVRLKPDTTYLLNVPVKRPG
jgi:hypothetical protein